MGEGVDDVPFLMGVIDRMLSCTAVEASRSLSRVCPLVYQYRHRIDAGSSYLRELGEVEGQVYAIFGHVPFPPKRDATKYSKSLHPHPRSVAETPP